VIVTLTTSKQPPAAAEPEFPALYRSLRTAGIVLFLTETSGVSLLPCNAAEYSEGWIHCTNKDSWERLPIGSTLTIGNTK